MADGEGEQKPQITEASKKALKNVAAVTSPFRWKARTPTPHPRKYKDPADKNEAAAGSTKEEEGVGIDNKGFNQEDIEVEAPKEAEGEPELVDEEKKSKLDGYFILLATIIGAAILAVALYFTITSVMPMEDAEPINDAGNDTMTTEAPFKGEATTHQKAE